MTKLEQIVKECLQKKIPVTGVKLMDNDTLGYAISGFAKSDTVIIYEDVDQIVWCVQRYNTVDRIDSFDDLTEIAYKWNKMGQGYGWEISSDWLPIFITKGWVETVTRTYSQLK